MHYELRIVHTIKHELHHLILLDRGAIVPQITGMNADLKIYLTLEFVISHLRTSKFVISQITSRLNL